MSENRAGDLYRRARRFRHLSPADAIPKYIDSIASAIANATPKTAYAASVDAIADAIVTAHFSCNPSSTENVVKQILASVRYKDSIDILVALQRKKIEVLKDTCDRMAILPDEVQKRVDDLVQLQKQHDDFEKQMLDGLAAAQANQDDMTEEAKLSDIEAVKVRFEKEFESLYEKRRAIVSRTSGEDEGAGEGVPNFWFSAMNAVKELKEEITVKDEMALEYLTDVRCGKIENPKGLKFEFFFDSNPFFKNDVLTKLYQYSSNLEGRFDIDSAKGTDIEWTNCLTHTTMRTRKRKCESCNCDLPKTFGIKSFFNFFKTLELPAEDEADDKVQEVIHDCRIRDVVQKTLFPRAVTCFLDSQVVEEEIQSMEKKLEEMIQTYDF